MEHIRHYYQDLLVELPGVITRFPGCLKCHILPRFGESDHINQLVLLSSKALAMITQQRALFEASPTGWLITSYAIPYLHTHIGSCSLRENKGGYSETLYFHIRFMQLSFTYTWWHHDMVTFYTLLALCEGNPPVTSGFHSQRAHKKDKLVSKHVVNN